MSSLETSPADRANRGGLRAGKYELLTRLAAGGMGEVFIARAVGSGAFEKRVALKLLLPHLTGEPEFVHMFLDEARIAARMNHPNIVQIFDLGEADGRYYLAMALVEGLSLSRLLKACRVAQLRPPLPLVRLIATSLCEGLSYAHELKGPRGEAYGVIHRDVNPHNLLISTAGQVLLTDFGIAKAQGNLHRTRPGDVRGKYAYMAPEQMKSGAHLDRRADLFSAAVTLYEAATLRQPFTRRTDPETMDAVRNDAIPDPLSLRPDMGEGMARALRRGMSRSVDERFATARELREAFVDGPVASPHELGEWLTELCGKELEIFLAQPEPDGTANLPRATQTRSLIASPPEPGAPPAAARAARWPLALIALAALAGGGLLWARPWAEATPAPLPAGGRAEPEPEPEPEVQAEAEPVMPSPARRAQIPRQRKVGGSASKAVPAARPPVPSLTVGYLTADAQPWAELFVDGKRVERTPLSRYPLPAGSHVLQFKNPELGKEARRTVTIEEGKTETVRVDLEQ